MNDLPRSQIRECNSPRIPSLLLGFIEYRLEKEIKDNFFDRNRSYVIELLYLFHDFMLKEYKSVILDEDVSHICNKDATDTPDIVNNIDFIEEGWCLKWCCKNEWHNRSIQILRLFVKLSKIHGILYYTCPCLSENTVKDGISSKSARSDRQQSVRKGGVFGIILDSILTLFRGWVSWRIKNCAILEPAVWESSDSSLYGYSSRTQNERQSYKCQPSRIQSSTILSTQDNDLDIQTLIRILNWLLFTIDTEIDNVVDKLGKVVMNNDGHRNSRFYCISISSKNSKTEIEKTLEYLDNIDRKDIEHRECDKNWLTHNSVYIRGYIICHILKWFHRFLDPETTEEYNALKDFNILSDEVVYETMVFLHNICSIGGQSLPTAEDRQFSVEILNYLKNKMGRSTLNKSGMFVDTSLEEEKQNQELSSSRSTIFKINRRSSNDSAEITENEDEFNFDNFKRIIDSLINYEASKKMAKEEMSLLLKSVKPEWLIQINRAFSTVHNAPIQSKHQGSDNARNSSSRHTPKLKYPICPIRDDKPYKKMEQFVNSEWIEQVKQSFYYHEDSEECISRWMQNMMKDKTSFWFDAIKYQEIRCDYKEVKNSYGDDLNKSNNFDTFYTW